MRLIMRNKLRKYFLANSSFLFGFVLAIVLNILATWHSGNDYVKVNYEYQSYSKLLPSFHSDKPHYFHNLETRNVTDDEDGKAVISELHDIECKFSNC